MNGWLVYILECGDGTLYTGITVDLKRRLDAHQRGAASKYTRARLPVKAIYQEAHRTRSSALRREALIKTLTHHDKLRLVLGSQSSPRLDRVRSSMVVLFGSILVAMASACQAMPRPGSNPHPPQPTEVAAGHDEALLQAGRREWRESLHRAAAGTDWRAIEKGDRARNWYLVEAVSCAAAGTYDSGDRIAPSDSGINASASACR